jgi:hypothetical protein
LVFGERITVPARSAIEQPGDLVRRELFGCRYLLNERDQVLRVMFHVKRLPVPCQPPGSPLDEFLFACHDHTVL